MGRKLSMQFPHLQDVNLEPLWEEELNHKLAIKHALLFSELNGVKTAIVQEETLGDALNYFSKLGLAYPITTLDDDSFERLKNKCLI